MRADARRNRERIIEVARAAYALEGSGVQMAALAHRAHVGVGTLYRHFRTKGALIRELGRDLVASRAQDAEAALKIADPWESIAWLVRRHSSGMERDAGLRESFAAVRHRDHSPFKADDLAGRVQALLDRAQRAGVLRDDVTVDDFHGLMCGLSVSIDRGADGRVHADVLLDGLRTRTYREAVTYAFIGAVDPERVAGAAS